MTKVLLAGCVLLLSLFAEIRTSGDGPLPNEPIEFHRTSTLLECPGDVNQSKQLTAVAFLDQGQIAAGDSLGDLFVHDIQQHAPPVMIRGQHTSPIRFLSGTDNRDELVALDTMGRLKFWSTVSGNATRELPEAHLVFAFALHDQQLITLGQDRTLQTWELTDEGSERLIHRVTEPLSSPYRLMASSSSGDRLLLVSDAQWQIRQRSTLKRKLQAKLADGVVSSIAISPSADSFTLGFADGSIEVRDGRTGKRKAKWKKHPNAVTSLTYSRSGKTLISGCLRDRIRVWDLERAEPANDRSVDTTQVFAMSLSSDDRQLTIVGEGRSVVLLKPRVMNSEIPARHRPNTWNNKAAMAVRWLKDSNQMAVVAKFGSVELFDGSDFRSTPGKPIDKSLGGAIRVQISPNGQFSAHAYGSGHVRVFETATGKLAHELMGPFPDRKCVAFSPDSRRLALVKTSLPCWRQVINLADGKAVFETSDYDQSAYVIRWDSKSDSIIGLARNRSVPQREFVLVRWSSETGDLLSKTALPESYSGTSMAVHPNGNRIAVDTGASGFVGIFDQDFSPVSRFEVAGKGGVHAMRWLDNERLLLGTYKGSVQLVNTTVGQELARLEPLPPRLAMPVRSIDVDPNGKFIAAVGGYDGKEKILVYAVDDLDKSKPTHVP